MARKMSGGRGGTLSHHTRVWVQIAAEVRRESRLAFVDGLRELAHKFSPEAEVRVCMQTPPDPERVPEGVEVRFDADDHTHYLVRVAGGQLHVRLSSPGMGIVVAPETAAVLTLRVEAYPELVIPDTKPNVEPVMPDAVHVDCPCWLTGEFKHQTDCPVHGPFNPTA